MLRVASKKLITFREAKISEEVTIGIENLWPFLFMKTSKMHKNEKYFLESRSVSEKLKMETFRLEKRFFLEVEMRKPKCDPSVKWK